MTIVKQKQWYYSVSGDKQLMTVTSSARIAMRKLCARGGWLKLKGVRWGEVQSWELKGESEISVSRAGLSRIAGIDNSECWISLILSIFAKQILIVSETILGGFWTDTWIGNNDFVLFHCALTTKPFCFPFCVLYVLQNIFHTRNSDKIITILIFVMSSFVLFVIPLNVFCSD